MKNKKIITISLIVTLIHFFLTSLIGHYIAVQVGSQIGRTVAEGLIEACEKKTNSAEEEGKRIYQNMQAKSDEIKEGWQIPELIISLPAKPLFTPFLKEINRNQINKVVTKEISRDQFRTQGFIIHYTANFLNSLSFGFLVYIMLRIINHYKKRRSQPA
jgi:cell division protein FtsB